MKEILTDLSKAIRPLKVSSFPKKIFICGGDINYALKDGKYLSMRHYICAHIKKTDSTLFENIILAEELNLWFQDDGSYADLLELEEDMAGLVSAIPLFLEGSGSFAEMGAFVLMPHIRDKVLLFLDDKYRDDRSFVGLGPVRRLAKKGKVYAYVWPRDPKDFFVSDINAHIAPDIVSAIKSFIKRASKTSNFNAAIAAHLILLISDIVDLLHISMVNEIRTVVNHLELSVDGKKLTLTPKTCKKYLLIAERFGLIHKINHGREQDAFYVYTAANQNGFIDYTYTTPAAHKSRIAWKIIIVDHIARKERKRYDVRKEWIKSFEGGES